MKQMIAARCFATGRRFSFYPIFLAGMPANWKFFKRAHAFVRKQNFTKKVQLLGLLGSLCIFLPALMPQTAFSQFNVNINTIAGPPVNPVIEDYIQSGNVRASLTAIAADRIWLVGKIEKITQPVFSITGNGSNYIVGAVGQPMISLRPGVTFPISGMQLRAAFGNFEERFLEVNGIDLNTLREENKLILPPGTYRICFMAYDVDFKMVSNPGTGCATFTVASPTPANAVTINTQLIPPANPDIVRQISRGNVKPIVLFNNPGGPQVGVKLFGKIEALAPKPFTIALNPDYFQQPPVALSPSIPVQLTSQQVMDAFGNFNPDALITTGISLDELRDEKNILKLPEGMYKICFYARYDHGGQLGDYASNVNLGCAGFNICYKAAAPQFTQPVSNFNIRNVIQTVKPTSPLIFAWTPPNATCGINLSQISYDFEIREMFDEQTPTDAVNNPPVYRKTGLRSPNFVFDTLLNQQVLQHGKKYIIRVKAETGLNSEIEMDNFGYSRVEAFVYGEPVKEETLVPAAIPKQNLLPVQTANCSCTFNLASVDKTPNNQMLQSGGSFQMASLTLKIGSLQTSGKTVSGEGTVSVEGIPVMVSFKDVVVNSGGIAIAGSVTGKTANGFDFLRNVPSPAISTENFDAFFDHIKNYNLDAVKNSAGIPLPFGLKQVGLPDQVNAGIVSLRITPTQAVYNAIAVVKLADANNVLSLLARDVCFSNSSLMCGDAVFTLENDFLLPGIQMNIKGYQSNADPGTFVRYANREMKQFRIHAEYIFPAPVFKNADGGELRAVLKADATGWSDWVAGVSIDPFRVSSLNEVVFTQKGEAWFDHSSKLNAKGMPASFTDPALSQKNSEIGNALWTGFYLPSLTVSLPALITDVKKKNKNIEVSAQHFIIDKSGITGVVSAANVVALNSGSLAGWYCSLDDIKIKFLNSSFKEGGLYGKVVLPFSDKDKKQSQIDYSCTMSSSSGSGGFAYQFVARQKKDIDFSAWWAKFSITNGSIMVSDASGTPVASANLSGNLNIEEKIEGYKVGMKLIEIEELQIKTEGPDYVKVKNAVMGFNSPQHTLSGFPVNIKNVKPDIKGANAGLKFDLKLTLSDLADKLLPDASATLRIGADIMPGERTVWRRSKLDLSEVKVKGIVAGLVHVDGSMKFFKEDPVFGDGIRATLQDVYFTGLEAVRISANAKFGNKNFNYWYFDASVAIPPVPVAPGLSINGFGGGAYYNLEKDPAVGKMLPKDYFKNMAAYKLDAFEPRSGVLGFNAKIAFCSNEGGALYSGFGEIGMSFGHGLNSMDGQLFFQALNPEVLPGKITPVNENAAIRGVINFHMGIPDKVLEIKGAVDIDMYNVMKGGGRFALLSDVAQGNYYLKLGVPDDRIFVDFAGLATLKAYFMAGNKLDISIPDPDPAIVDVSKLSGYSKIPVPISGGLAFGASLKVQDELKYFPFKIDAHAGLGFDINLGRATAKCEGSKTNALPGINGWYATGQVYAGIGGRFSLFVDVFFYTGEVEIANLDASVLLRGGLPNPWWFDGHAMLKYNVLDGLIAGDVNFKISMGDKCEQETQIFTQPLIASVSPENGKKEVPLNAYLEAGFNYTMEEEFLLVIPDSKTGKTETRSFRILVEECRVTDVATGKTFADHRDPKSYPYYTDNRRKLLLSPEDALMPQTNYVFRVTAKAQEFGYDARLWKDVYFKNEPVRETKETKFKTGECNLEEYITSKKNRIGAFPFPGQRYFLPGEARQGALVLDRNYVCSDTRAKDYTLVAKFIVYQNRQKISESESAVSAAGKYLKFDIPELTTQSLVQVQIVRRMTYARNSFKVVGNKIISETSTQKLDVPLYTYHFQTSRYRTLAEKLKSMSFKSVKGYFLNAPLTEMSAVENFDQYDAVGFKSDTYQNNEMFFTMPLVNLRETKAYNTWSKNAAFPVVYDYYFQGFYNVFDIRKARGFGKSVAQAQFIDPYFPPGLSSANYAPLSPVEIINYDAPLSQKEIEELLPAGLVLIDQMQQRSANLSSFIK